MTEHPPRRRPPWRLAWIAMLALPVACRDEPGRDDRRPAPLPGLVALEPGTEVGQGPPTGWSHRVIRSVPRLASGDLDGLPSSAGETATRFRTVIAADVAGSRGGFQLARVGVGNAVPTPDGERVVTPGGPDAVLETLGVVDRVVLIAAQARLDRGALVARSPTFALFRTPTVLVIDGEHRDVDLCYALLVDPATGALAALCWPLPAGSSAPPDALTLLPPDLAFDAPLDARATRRIGPVAVSWSFALSAMPPGRRIPVPDALAPALALPADPNRMERALRRLADPADRP